MYVDYLLLMISKETIGGAFAGVVGTILGFPLDTIKTRMQFTQEGSMMRASKRIFLEDGGISGFYRGVASPLIALTVLNTVNFSSYGYFRGIFSVPKDLSRGRFEYRVTLSAMMVGPIASAISTPFEMVKTQMQLQRLTAAVGHKNSIRCAQTIISSHGINGLYRGHVVNTWREVVFLGTYFTVYEHIKSTMVTTIPSSLSIPISGGVSGALGWFVSFPLDCIKANIQGRELSSKNIDSSILKVGASLINQKGIGGLYAGVAPSIVRAFIVSSSRFSAYEFVCWVLEETNEC